MGFPGFWEIIVIAIVIMVLFGAKKMPEAARSLGRSMRIFKAETKGLEEDDSKESQQHEENSTPGEQQAGGQAQQRSSAESDQPVVDGKVVNRDQARESH